MKKLIAATIAVAFVFAAAPAHAKSSDYSNKRKNQYWSAMKRISPDAKFFGKKDTVETGTLVCDYLREGATVADLAVLVYEADASIEDFVIAGMAVAPIYLCPDQQYKFE